MIILLNTMEKNNNSVLIVDTINLLWINNLKILIIFNNEFFSSKNYEQSFRFRLIFG